MLAQDKKRLQETLESYICEMSKNFLETDEEKKEMADKLLVLYRKTGFRHSYSNFFPLILKISKDENDYNTETLAVNLQALRDYVESVHVTGKTEYNALYYRLEKLCDHLNLEIARWSYYSQNEHRIEDVSVKTANLKSEFQKTQDGLKISNIMIEQAKEELGSAKAELTAVKEELVEASNLAKNIQLDVIAVLSIFAGIVFAFAGGFTYLGSVMVSIKDVKHYEAVVLMAIICGMVVFNTLFLMMYLVGKITKREIQAKCNQGAECPCGQKCGQIDKIRRRLPYIYWFNLFAILGIIINMLVWYCDIRNWFYL